MTKIHVVRITLAVMMSLILSAVWADPVPVTPFAGQDFSTFGVTGANTSLMASPFSYGSLFSGTFYSQVFDLSDGEFLYLYQAHNAGKSVLEVINVSNMYDITSAGFLNANEPTGFTAGGQKPYKTLAGDYAVTYDVVADGSVSYGYYTFLGASIKTGNNSTVLFIKSSNAPVIGEVYLIDTGVAVCSAFVTAVPEPSSIIALVGGLGSLLAFRRRRA